MRVNTLYKDTTCIHNVSTLHFILYKLPTPHRSVTEMVAKQTSRPDGNKLLLTRIRDKRGLKRRDSDADIVSGDHGRGRLICFWENRIWAIARW